MRALVQSKDLFCSIYKELSSRYYQLIFFLKVFQNWDAFLKMYENLEVRSPRDHK